MGNLPHTDIYECINTCEDACEIENVKIIRYESSLYYANVENFVYKVIKLSGVNPNDIESKIKKKQAEYFKKAKKLKEIQVNI